MITVDFEIKQNQIPEYLSVPCWERTLLVDIETTGFRPGEAEIYLIGCAYVKNGTWLGHQWLSESFLDEQKILKDFLAFSEEFDELIHFNGCMFDVPFIEKTCRTYGLPCRLGEKQQLDLLKIARKCRGFLSLNGLRQKEVETFLGISRDDIFTGGELIEVFEAYKQTKDLRLQKTLLLHNADDVRGMIPLLSLLTYYETCVLQNVNRDSFEYEVSQGMLKCSVKVPYRFPKTVTHENEFGNVTFKDSSITFSVPVSECRLKSYLPHPENYYYLPSEDMVIHKKIASTVDDDHKVKATREQCFVLSEGPFVPALKGMTLAQFRKSLDDKSTFVLLKDIDLPEYLHALILS